MAADPLVLDASVAVRAALVVNGFDVLRRYDLQAPTLLWSEVGSALTQLLRRGEVSTDEVSDALERLLGVDITAYPSSELMRAAIDLASRRGWAKTYDAEYVVLSQRLDVPLLTLDARLARAVRTLVRLQDPSRL